MAGKHGAIAQLHHWHLSQSERLAAAQSGSTWVGDVNGGPLCVAGDQATEMPVRYRHRVNWTGFRPAPDAPAPPSNKLLQVDGHRATP